MQGSFDGNIVVSAFPDIANLMNWCRSRECEFSVQCRTVTVATNIGDETATDTVYFCDARVTTPERVSIEVEGLSKPGAALERAVSLLRGKVAS